MGYHEQLMTLGLTVVSLSWILHVCFSSRPFYDKRISAEVGVDFLGDEWKVWGCMYCCIRMAVMMVQTCILRISSKYLYIALFGQGWVRPTLGWSTCIFSALPLGGYLDFLVTCICCCVHLVDYMKVYFYLPCIYRLSEGLTKFCFFEVLRSLHLATWMCMCVGVVSGSRHSVQWDVVQASSTATLLSSVSTLLTVVYCRIVIFYCHITIICCLHCHVLRSHFIFIIHPSSHSVTSRATVSVSV